MEWDHPRICGEKQKDTLYLIEDVGSPPHMRGKEFRAAAADGLMRITPAYAGKSPPASR